MIFSSTKIKDLIVIENTKHRDKRGYFIESFVYKEFNKSIKNINFIQENISFSKKGVLRGLHFQKGKYAQSKLLKVIYGNIFDVAVDLRKNSKTYKKYFSILLSSKKNNQLFIPKGFAHGFLTLSSHAIVSYKVDKYYNQATSFGYKYNDKTFNIKWPPLKSKIIMSNKDKNLPYFSE